MQANTVEDVEAQDRMLREANEKLDRLKCAADLLIAVEFTPGSAANKRAARDDAALRVTASFHHTDLATFRREAREALGGQTTLHWPLEFPEVIVERGGFDALVGNPPFMGGQKITGTLGDPYREYLVRHLANGKRGSADICAYFFIRGTRLLRQHGQLGSLATNTIAQGDTREVGLDQLLDGSCVIPRAVRSLPWPGVASLEIALVWVRKGKWASLFILDDKPTTGISAFLTTPGTVTGNPNRLKANEGKVFQGPIILGMGFTMSPPEAKSFIALDPANEEVLFPYIGGEDLTSRFDVTPSRWVINFGDMPLIGNEISHGSPRCAASHYPDLLKLVESKVRPQREKDKRKLYRDKWWQFAEKRRELTKAIESLRYVFVRPRVSSTHAVVRIPAEWVVSNTLYVFAAENWSFASLIQSSIHEEWVKAQSSTLKEDTTYHPTDCFETFPFPSSLASVEGVGEKYHAHRQQLMLDNKEGLTRTYHRFHDPKECNQGVQQIRELHAEIDNAVAVAYGWSDLDLNHGFHETKQGVRYTISEDARREVLARLLRLNHERYADEVKRGLHDTKKAKATTKPKPPKVNVTAETTLFDTAFPSTDREKVLCGLLCDLVAGEPNLRFDAYSDALMIAVQPKVYERVLSKEDRKPFVKLVESLKVADPGARLPWRDIKDTLLANGAIEEVGTSFIRGSRFDLVRPDYLECDPKAVDAVRKVAAALRELQNLGQSAPADGQRVLSKHAEVKRAQAGATP